jgi:hypothetical protein
MRMIVLEGGCGNGCCGPDRDCSAPGGQQVAQGAGDHLGGAAQVFELEALVGALGV